jgi:recombination protein RecA
LQLGKPCQQSQNHLHFYRTKDHRKAMPNHDFDEPDQDRRNSTAGGGGTGAALSTGFVDLDQALGLGGYPRGQICEIYGPPACGKTSLLLRAIAAAQRAGVTCAFIDGDHSLNVNHTACCGVDVQNLYLSDPASVEQALEITLTLAQSGAVGLIAIDTLTAFPTQAGLRTAFDAETEKVEYQKFERYVAQAIWRLSKACQKTGSTILISNQLRCKPGSLYHEGPATTATLALKMHAAVRLAMEPWNDQPIGGSGHPKIPNCNSQDTLRAQIRIIKNKFAPITGHINLIIMYNHE